ncbi:MAG: hypothetical protein RIE73_10500 [Coleofasciculus sp. C1-SOL-03]|jgi:hypothetical protein|uniref:hypothetical protein n=1 Tax=Coleofasciculus sp. C1-SOL-03 TaxID=3069522 RepID=UPI0032F33BCF
MDQGLSKLESLKMLKEWSIWLFSIQTAICTLLWERLDFKGIRIIPNVFLHLGWFSFGFSVIIATVILSRIPVLIENLGNDVSDSSVLHQPLKILGIKLRLKFLVRAEHILFLLGVFFVFIFILNKGLGVVS